MILVDNRAGSKELLPHIHRFGCPAELTKLEYGDAAFTGNGPKGPIDIGIERKTLNDMLACIEDARYSSTQMTGMSQCYARSFLCLEGLWEPGLGGGYKGILMAGFRNGMSWGAFRSSGNRTTMYSKLYRYMLSLSLNGVIVTQSGHLEHTAYNICEIYQYFMKGWKAHTSLAELPKLHLPTLNGKPSLVRLWAAECPGVGTVMSEDAERLFKTGRALANADESDWLRIPGLGAKKAKQIVKEIMGWK